MLKVGYFADGRWGHNAFEKLISDKEIEIKFICVRFDSTDFKFNEYAQQYNLPLIKHNNINSDEFIAIIKQYDCDLFISMSFNQIFKKKMIALTPFRIINCHAGKLPSYRGRNILNWALINDEKEFGITVHYVDSGIDTGEIIIQECYPITDQDNYQTLLEVAYLECPKLLYKAVCLFKNGKAKSYSQDDLDSPTFYCGKREAGDEKINWNQTSREIFNFIRAICSPGPRATSYSRDQEIKINFSKFIPNLKAYKGIPGQIIGKTKDGFFVKTLDSYIEINEIESPVKLRVGDRLNESE